MLSVTDFCLYLFQLTMPPVLPELYQKPEWLPHFDFEGIPSPNKIIIWIMFTVSCLEELDKKNAALSKHFSVKNGAVFGAL